jgi:hypothetical protein
MQKNPKKKENDSKSPQGPANHTSVAHQFPPPTPKHRRTGRKQPPETPRSVEHLRGTCRFAGQLSGSSQHDEAEALELVGRAEPMFAGPQIRQLQSMK